MTAKAERTVLVTGASGFLGWHICRAASASWHVVGLFHQHETAIEGVEVRRVDLSIPDEARSLLNSLRPDAVIHAAAYSQPNLCEQYPEVSEAVNLQSARTLAQWCGDADVPLLFTSTDLVFDGTQAPYSEEDATSPVSVYGRHKVAAEQVVLALGARGIVCRLPLMFGDRGGAPASFIGPWLRTLREREPLSLFVDEFRTPVSGAVAAQGLLMALASDVSGLLHLGGHERISRYDFGLKLADVFGLPTETIRGCRLAEVKMSAARPPDVSLDSSKAFGLGYTPGTIEDQLIAVARHYNHVKGVEDGQCR